jgi:hypothetical protein
MWQQVGRKKLSKQLILAKHSGFTLSEFDWGGRPRFLFSEVLHFLRILHRFLVCNSSLPLAGNKLYFLQQTHLTEYETSESSNNETDNSYFNSFDGIGHRSIRSCVFDPCKSSRGNVVLCCNELRRPELFLLWILPVPSLPVCNLRFRICLHLQRVSKFGVSF